MIEGCCNLLDVVEEERESNSTGRLKNKLSSADLHYSVDGCDGDSGSNSQELVMADADFHSKLPIISDLNGHGQ